LFSSSVRTLTFFTVKETLDLFPAPLSFVTVSVSALSRLRLKCDGTRAETRFHLSTKWMSPFKSAGESVQLTTGSWGVCIRGSNAGYTMFWGSVKSTGYPIHSPVSPSLPLLCVTMCHYISTGLEHNSILHLLRFWWPDNDQHWWKHGAL